MITPQEYTDLILCKKETIVFLLFTGKNFRAERYAGIINTINGTFNLHGKTFLCARVY